MMALPVTGKRLCLFLCLVLLTVSAVANAAGHAAEVEIPDGITVMAAEDLVRLARDHADLIMIDSRSPADRELGYIEGSIALPDDQTSCDSLKRISRSFVRPLMFYCNGLKCDRSRHAILKAHACGYTKLYWFKGGFEEWRAKHFPILRSR